MAKGIVWWLVPVPDAFSIGEAAAILGISPPTLRAWERRYGILRPRRTRTNQRRYTVGDLQVLARVKEASSQAGVDLRRAADDATREPVRNRDAAATPVEDDMVWRFVVDLFDRPILLLDLSGRVLDANEGAAKKLGVERRALRSRHLSSYVRREDRERCESITRTPLQQRRNLPLRLSTRRGERSLDFDCWPIAHQGTLMVALIGQEARTVETRDLEAALRRRGQPGSSGAAPST